MPPASRWSQQTTCHSGSLRGRIFPLTVCPSGKTWKLEPGAPAAKRSVTASASWSRISKRANSWLARQAADLIERTLAEDALRESEERFRLIANTAPVMIWMSGTDNDITYVNQTWLDYVGPTDALVE